MESVMHIINFVLLFSSGPCEPPWALPHQLSPTFWLHGIPFSAMFQGAILPLIGDVSGNKTWVLGCLLWLKWHCCWMLQCTGSGGECVHSPMHTSRRLSPCPSEVPPPHSIATWTIPAPHWLFLTSLAGRHLPSSPSQGSSLEHEQERWCGWPTRMLQCCVIWCIHMVPLAFCFPDSTRLRST